MNINGPLQLSEGREALTRLIAGELIAGTDADTIARKVCEFLGPMMLDIAEESRRLGADIQCPECNWVKNPVKLPDGREQIMGATTFGGHLIHPCDSGCCNAQFCTECKKFWKLVQMSPKEAEHYVELVTDLKTEAGNERKDGEDPAQVG